MKRIIAIILLIAIFYVVKSGFYIVDERKQVVLTLFQKGGAIIGKPVTKPGLKFKIPVFHVANVYAKNLLEWDGDPKKPIPTGDKTNIWVYTFCRWRIKDPIVFMKKVRNETSAQQKLDNIINGALRNLVSSHNLKESVRNTDRKMRLNLGSDTLTEDTTAYNIVLGRSAMCQHIRAQAQPKLLDLGIELVDVRIKRINYVNDVLQDVFRRMIAERKQFAEKYRSEGRGESQQIIGEKEKELKRIYSEAYRKAEVIKGKADAKATKIYAAAYNRDPEFYSFIKTLDLYKKSFDSTNTLIMSTKNNDFLKYFKQYSPSKR